MWVARNKNGQLTLFEGRPTRDEENEIWNHYTIYSNCTDSNIQHFSAKILDRKMFPELKWEDEPIEVTLTSSELINKVKELSNCICSAFLGKPDDNKTNGDILVCMREIDILLNKIINTK